MPAASAPDLTRSDDNRTVLCGRCQRPAKLVEDERTGRIGYSCRDSACANSRRLLALRDR